MEVQILLKNWPAILIEEYGYTDWRIAFFGVRSVKICDLFLFQNNTTSDIDEPQKPFISQRNCYNYLQITERLYTFAD
jgi:hypothetical protein